MLGTTVLRQAKVPFDYVEGNLAVDLTKGLSELSEPKATYVCDVRDAPAPRCFPHQGEIYHVEGLGELDGHYFIEQSIRNRGLLRLYVTEARKITEPKELPEMGPCDELYLSVPKKDLENAPRKIKLQTKKVAKKENPARPKSPLYNALVAGYKEKHTNPGWRLDFQ